MEINFLNKIYGSGICMYEISWSHICIFFPNELPFSHIAVLGQWGLWFEIFVQVDLWNR